MDAGICASVLALIGQVEVWGELSTGVQGEEGHWVSWALSMNAGRIRQGKEGNHGNATTGQLGKTQKK